MFRKSLAGLVVGAMVGGVIPLGAQAQPSEAGDSEARRRSSSQIVLMQHALELAVRSGANDLLTKLSRISQLPPFAQLLGQPQAHGFELPAYGMFFYVRVPGMSGTLLNALPFLMEVDMQQRQAQAGATPPQRRGLARPAGVAGEAVAPPVSPADPGPVITPADLDVLKDPDPHYVQAIRAAIIDAMLENSRSLRLQPDEHLTVAAREDTTPDPLDPNDRLQTMLFSIQGRVLADYHQDRMTLEEARRLVTVTTD